MHLIDTTLVGRDRRARRVVAGGVDLDGHGFSHASHCRGERHRLNAFTLVELLIAVTITVLIVVLLGTMFSSLTSTTSRANQRVDAFRDARAALQMMERDLSGIVRGQWDTTKVPPTPITRPAAYFALDNIYVDPAPGNQQIYALIAAKNTGSGDVCAVGYYCRWDDEHYGYSLRRFFLPSNDTDPARSTFKILADAGAYIGPAALYKPDPAGTATANLRDDLLAAHVWNLKVTAYDSAGVVMAIVPPYVCDPDAAAPASLPAAIEISFKVMSAEAARTVIAAQAPAGVWMNEADAKYQRLIGPHVYEFRTRIRL